MVTKMFSGKCVLKIQHEMQIFHDSENVDHTYDKLYMGFVSQGIYHNKNVAVKIGVLLLGSILDLETLLYFTFGFY